MTRSLPHKITSMINAIAITAAIGIISGYFQLNLTPLLKVLSARPASVHFPLSDNPQP